MCFLFHRWPSLPAINGIFALDTALELERCFEPGWLPTLRVVDPSGVGHVCEHIIPHPCGVALLIPEQRTLLPLALDHVVPNRDRLEVAAGIEAEQPFHSRGGRGARDNVVVANLKVVEDLIDPSASINPTGSI